jgi:hypothetical protein
MDGGTGSVVSILAHCFVIYRCSWI